MTRDDLTSKECNPYFATYINQVPQKIDLLEALKEGKVNTVAFFNAISKDKEEYRYDLNKWTPKEVLLHLIDTERIFAYRALRFARKDQTNLPGFEQDDYIPPSKANLRSMDSLIIEYQAVREATIQFYENLDNEMLESIGYGSGNAFSPRALGFINAGHEIHHMNIIKERYL